MTVKSPALSDGRTIEDPPLAKFLFSDVRMAWFWLVIRLWVGYKWIDAGWHKVTGEGYMDGGSSLQSYWERAVAIPAEGRPAISFDWYRSFLQFMLDTESYTWFGPAIAVGEVLVGVGLIVGAFVGIAAFFGALMNWNFIMAGSASTNGVLLILAIGLMLAWKIAGYYGADYYLLRWLGVPWKSRPAKTEAEVVQPGLATAR
jgi:thiosulfate dehydrogenase [quinone] large subunit